MPNRKFKQMTAKHKLMNDVARCDGVSFENPEGLAWREDCERCLRRIAPRPDECVMMAPPPIIVFECEYLIEEPL